MLNLPPESAALLDEPARAWLDAALLEAAHAARHTPPPHTATAPPAASPPVPAWELRFASAGRHCGSDLAAEAARILLLRTARTGAPGAARLYHRGTAAERRAVLLALPFLEIAPAHGLPLIQDALRTNDTRLLAAAVGPYAAAHLDAHAWRHAVLKCLFTGVPLDAVARLAHRARGDTELARMLEDYAAERTAAGRPVPADLHHALALTTAAKESS
ncbi:EboA domain-containing protein [Streptomyces sp. N2-109]|uniref:EboA domain-containing protein n=1 Tax=Streptomyces gossypii TaxID=2883101 RepID=A0ABT2JME4_9ACTN|nr:EboA domain-containing protein [Streptomyces gossypii]MCT2588429.1 EboA domain-containing protein [Streptomyces gossypii]